MHFTFDENNQTSLHVTAAAQGRTRKTKTTTKGPFSGSGWSTAHTSHAETRALHYVRVDESQSLAEMNGYLRHAEGTRSQRRKKRKAGNVNAHSALFEETHADRPKRIIGKDDGTHFAPLVKFDVPSAKITGFDSNRKQAFINKLPSAPKKLSLQKPQPELTSQQRIESLQTQIKKTTATIEATQQEIESMMSTEVPALHRQATKMQQRQTLIEIFVLIRQICQADAFWSKLTHSLLDQIPKGLSFMQKTLEDIDPHLDTFSHTYTQDLNAEQLNTTLSKIQLEVDPRATVGFFNCIKGRSKTTQSLYECFNQQTPETIKTALEAFCHANWINCPEAGFGMQPELTAEQQQQIYLDGTPATHAH